MSPDLALRHANDTLRSLWLKLPGVIATGCAEIFVVLTCVMVHRTCWWRVSFWLYIAIVARGANKPFGPIMIRAGRGALASGWRWFHQGCRLGPESLVGRHILTIEVLE
jgi:hypothetical protein